MNIYSVRLELLHHISKLDAQLLTTIPALIFTTIATRIPTRLPDLFLLKESTDLTTIHALLLGYGNLG